MANGNNSSTRSQKILTRRCRWKLRKLQNSFRNFWYFTFGAVKFVSNQPPLPVNNWNIECHLSKMNLWFFMRKQAKAHCNGAFVSEMQYFQKLVSNILGCTLIQRLSSKSEHRWRAFSHKEIRDICQRDFSILSQVIRSSVCISVSFYIKIDICGSGNLACQKPTQSYVRMMKRYFSVPFFSPFIPLTAVAYFCFFFRA